MPNHITNKIELLGDESDIERLKSHMIGFPFDGGTEEKRKSIFDFNKIVPRPDELDITSDGWISLLENQFSWNESLKSRLDSHRSKDGYEFTDRDSQAIDNFAQGIKNYLKYGSACWYGWSIENWGTKWNAYSVDKEWNKNSITFETAWSNVGGLIEQLSVMFPDVEIRYLYADEDTGCNCGKAIYKNGCISFAKLENSSAEAYELAFELNPEDKQYYTLVDGKYTYNDEDE